MKIPEDPFMLLSFINMKLRDGEYNDFTDLCQTIGCNEKDITAKLESVGFEYIPELKQFK